MEIWVCISLGWLVYKIAVTKTKKTTQPTRALCVSSGVRPGKTAKLLFIDVSESDIKTTYKGPTNGLRWGGLNGDCSEHDSTWLFLLPTKVGGPPSARQRSISLTFQTEVHASLVLINVSSSVFLMSSHSLK